MFVRTLIGSGAISGRGSEVVYVARRHKLSLGMSQSMFTRNAMRVHPYNGNVMTGPGGPMRGGIRL